MSQRFPSDRGFVDGYVKDEIASLELALEMLTRWSRRTSQDVRGFDGSRITGSHRLERFLYIVHRLIVKRNGFLAHKTQV